MKCGMGEEKLKNATTGSKPQPGPFFYQGILARPTLKNDPGKGVGDARDNIG
jgi:hypothetical protein